MSTITTGKVIIYKPNFNVNPVDTLLDLPVLGAENTLYVIKDTGAIYLWNGSEFIIYDSRPYKVYTALLTQSGTDAPVATILENTLGGTVVWSYDGFGSYIGSLNGAFTENKTFIQATIEFASDATNVTTNRITNNTINYQTYLPGDGNYNNSVVNLEVRVYP